MDRVRVKDIVDLVDYNRTGKAKITLADSEGFAVVGTSSMILDIIADFTVASLSADGGTIMVGLMDEDFDRFEKMEAQE